MTTYRTIVVDHRFTQPGNGKRRPIREVAVLLLDDEFCARYAALSTNAPAPALAAVEQGAAVLAPTVASGVAGTRRVWPGKSRDSNPTSEGAGHDTDALEAR